MSYVDEVYARVVRENPSQPEFHQAVREVLDSLRAVIECNEEKYRREALLVGGRSGSGAGQQRLPRAVFQRHRPV